MKQMKHYILLIAIFYCACANVIAQGKPLVLKAEKFKHYVDYFNVMEDENIAQAIPNADSWAWMKQNIPLFECPQQNFEEMFYFRWWTLRKHIKRQKRICLYRIPGSA